jgi:hypothetical protein
MRPIKFKCWHPGKGWISEEQVMEFNIGMLTHATGVTFYQFTGLHDRNKKEIFECDIIKNNTFVGVIKFESYDDDESWTKKHLGWIIEYPLCFYGSIRSLVNDHSRIEVIGNIHENEDLLLCKHEISSIVFDTLPETKFCIKCNKTFYDENPELLETK